MSDNRKTGWETVKPEQRAGLISAGIVLLIFPFFWPGGFVANMLASLGTAALAFAIAWYVSRKRHT